MKIYKISQLRPNTLLDCALYSTVQGIKLLPTGVELTHAFLKSLQNRQEGEVYGLNFEEELILLDEQLTTEGPQDPLIPHPKTLNLDLLKEGDDVPQDVYTCKGVLLWATQTRKVTPHDIECLSALGQAVPGSTHVWYGDQIAQRGDPVVRSITAHLVRIKSAKTKKKKARQPEKAFEKIAPTEKLGLYLQKLLPQERTTEEVLKVATYYDQSLGQLEQTLGAISKGTRIGTESLRRHRSIVEDTVKTILRDCNLAMNLLNRSPNSDYLIAHTFKVSILALEVATEMGLSKQEIMNIGLAANVQDLGMLCQPRALLNKTTPLIPSELQEIHRHPIYSVSMLERAKGMSEDVLAIVRQAHEKLDGSGYPAGLSGDRVHPLARILTAVNMYVAMISPRPYRSALATYDAVFFLLQNANHKKLDREAVKTILKVLSLFPIGTLVELKTGDVAKVVGTNEEAYTRPVVSLICDGDRRFYSSPRVIDLLSADRLEITRIVNPKEFPQISADAGF